MLLLLQSCMKQPAVVISDISEANSHNCTAAESTWTGGTRRNFTFTCRSISQSGGRRRTPDILEETLVVRLLVTQGTNGLFFSFLKNLF